jgi:hypothetical protein
MSEIFISQFERAIECFEKKKYEECNSHLSIILETVLNPEELKEASIIYHDLAKEIENLKQRLFWHIEIENDQIRIEEFSHALDFYSVTAEYFQKIKSKYFKELK